MYSCTLTMPHRPHIELTLFGKRKFKILWVCREPTSHYFRTQKHSSVAIICAYNDAVG